jgi:hypothetical protein
MFLQKLTEGLATMSNTTHLDLAEILGCGGDTEDEGFTASFDAALPALITEAAKNPSLRVLNLPSCRFPAAVDQSLADLIKSDTCQLEELMVLRFVRLPGERLTRAPHFLEAMKSCPKSTLQKISFRKTKYSIDDRIHSDWVDPWDPALREDVKCILRLNNSGRSYLVDDATNKQKGIAVLERVNDDMNCLFIHLTENPSLCRPCASNSSERSCRKRQRTC